MSEEKQLGVSVKERIPFLDVVRGFAMLGIVFVNYFLMVDSAMEPSVPSEGKWENVVAWFAAGKFYTLFSFLFGVGFMIFMERAQQRVASPRRLFVRRVLILFAIGLLHITFIWVGDILALYGLCGLLLILFYNRKPKTWLIWVWSMLGVYSLPFLAVLGVALFDPSYGAKSQEEEPVLGMASYNMDLSYLTSIGERWYDIGSIAFIVPLMALSVLSMFLLGAYAMRKGWFTDMSTKKPFWTKLWLVTAAGYLLTQFGQIGGTLADSPDKTTVYEAIALLGDNLGGVTGSLFYLSSLAVLYLYVPALRKLFKLFSFVGRMSLTCYLLHSIIGTLLFLGYAFGLADDVSSTGVALICLGVYGIQIVFSALWLKQFRYGPAEWVWRKLTYGK